MKILVGNHALDNPGGSETFTFALVAELARRGHNVTCIAGGSKKGMVACKIRELGVPVYIGVGIEGEYDLALLSHSISIELAKNVNAFKVQICHGIHHVLEQPQEKGIQSYVAVSEEVQRHLLNKRIISHVIVNGVDCERFKPIAPINTTLKTVLSLSQNEVVNNLLKRICQQINVKLLTQNKHVNPIWEVENEINKADLVVSLGRGVYESMACGRNAVILDKRNYMEMGLVGDGFVTPENISLFVKNNCSGRYSKLKLKEEDILKEFSFYQQHIGHDLRLIALKQFNIEKQVDQYLKLLQ